MGSPLGSVIPCHVWGEGERGRNTGVAGPGDGWCARPAEAEPEEYTLNEREFLERGGVSQDVWPSIRPYEKTAVRSPDAQFPGPLPSTLHVGRLMGSSSTARQYNIAITCKCKQLLEQCCNPAKSQTTSRLSHRHTRENRRLLKFFSTATGRHAYAWQPSLGSREADAPSDFGARGDAGCDWRQCGCTQVMYRGCMRCSAGTPETELAPYEPPMSVQARGIAVGLLLLVLLPAAIFPRNARPLLIGHSCNIAGRINGVCSLETFSSK